jgi:hypothetical protein
VTVLLFHLQFTMTTVEWGAGGEGGAQLQVGRLDSCRRWGPSACVYPMTVDSRSTQLQLHGLLDSSRSERGLL